MGARARTPSGRTSSTGAAHAGRGPARRRPCCCGPTCPRPPNGCWRRSGAPERSLSQARAARRPRAAGAGDRAAVPEGRAPPSRADGRAQRDRLPHPPRPLRAAERRARRRRPTRPGVDADADRRHRRGDLPGGAGRRRDFPRSTRRSAATPTPPRGFDDADLAELRELAAHDALRGDRRDRARLLPRHAPRDDQRRAFAAQIELAARARQAARDPHPRGGRRAPLDAARRRSRRRASVGDPALLLDARAARRVPASAADWISFAGNVTYPSAASSRAAAARVPERAAAGRDRRALPDPAGRARQPQPARLRGRTPRASWPSCAASTRQLGEALERNAARLFGWDEPCRIAPAQPSLRRLRSFGVRPAASSARTSSSTRTSSA